MPRLNIHPVIIREQQRRNQPSPDNRIHAPLYDPREDERFQYRPVPPEKKEDDSYTIRLN